MKYRVWNTVGALIFLGFGLAIGLAVEHLWLNVGEGVSTPARAAVRENTAAAARIAPRPSKQNAVTDVVERVSPSVVTVGAFKSAIVAQPWFDDFFLGPHYRLSEKRQRVPYMGSGFVIDEEGHVVTNYHVIEDSESFFVTLPDGREVDARLVDADRYIDVALLKVDTSALEKPLPPPLEFADSSGLRIGEQVMALGNPFGNFIDDSQPTLTVGYISALNRTFRPDRENLRVYQDMIQTDAAINPGNSGGPLVDINGDVVGMNTFIYSPSGASAGIGFAIPAKRIEAFLEEIRKYGRQRPLLLDFAFRTVRTGRNDTAVQVLGMDSSGPAAKAGLEPRDLILAIDGREVANREEVYLLLASKQVGDEVELEVLRRGEEPFTIAYTLQEAPKE